jgi:hypothetical protein
LPADLKTLQSLSGSHTWTSEDGAIILDVKGNTVLVSESLNADITNQFRAAVLGTADVAHGSN